MQGVLLIYDNKNTPRAMLLNGDVLNLSMDVIKDMLGLDAASNAE